MFTGLVQAVGSVVEMTANDFGARLVVDAGGWAHQPRPGDSIAVSGCCLTYVPAAPGRLTFDVIAETLRKTTLGALAVGGKVNLESCLTPSTPIGGHFVQGHVDGVAIVRRVHAGEGERRLTIETDEDVIRYIVPTGSIAVDGVSLTVASVDPSGRAFDVALIPTTLELTTLRGLKDGDRVNLEGDVLVKSVVNYLRHHAGPSAV